MPQDAATQIRLLGPDDLPLLLAVPPGMFDHPVKPEQARAFLNSPLHALGLALAGGEAVAFASGTILLHPDKPPALFVKELGTREGHRRRGHGRAVLGALIAHAQARGCQGVWLGTEPGNAAMIALCRSLGAEELPFLGFGWDGAFA
ncbi:MAG: N-acetyltransferase family protein [Alkalilacustris sp.]